MGREAPDFGQHNDMNSALDVRLNSTNGISDDAVFHRIELMTSGCDGDAVREAGGCSKRSSPSAHCSFVKLAK